MQRERNYLKDIEIDENDLEKEWVEHPSNVMHYHDVFADAQYNRDILKTKLEKVSARLDLEVRKDWSKHFDSKPTEAAIKSYLILHKDYCEAEETYLEAVKVMTSITGVKSAFEHKKTALQNIVSLRVMGYHSEPRNLIRDEKIKTAKREETHKELTKKMKKRRK
jgi:hypothetical protein